MTVRDRFSTMYRNKSHLISYIGTTSLQGILNIVFQFFKFIFSNIDNFDFIVLCFDNFFLHQFYIKRNQFF